MNCRLKQIHIFRACQFPATEQILLKTFAKHECKAEIPKFAQHAKSLKYFVYGFLRGDFGMGR